MRKRTLLIYPATISHNHIINIVIIIFIIYLLLLFHFIEDVKENPSNVSYDNDSEGDEGGEEGEEVFVNDNLPRPFLTDIDLNGNPVRTHIFF